MGLIDKVGIDSRWVTIGFTWNGLRALGVDEASLATFPEEFRQAMAARAEILGTTGANHPDYWVGGLASQDLHAIPCANCASVPVAMHSVTVANTKSQSTTGRIFR
jgi:hypothetical protein